DLGGMYMNWPKLSLLIAVVFFSLVGIPPLSGFWPKIYLFEAGFEMGQYAYIGALIVGSFVTLYAIARVWAAVFWKDFPQQEFDHRAVLGTLDFVIWPKERQVMLVLPIGLLALVSLYIGFAAEHVVLVVE